MKSSRMMWVLVTVVVLTTIAITFGTRDSRSQEKIRQAQSTPTPANPFGDFSKFPTVDYDAVESLTAPELEQRRIKNKRYQATLDVMQNPRPDGIAIITSDGEPLPPAIPFAESRLIVIGDILSSTARLTDGKKEIYSEYSVRIKTILKKDKQREPPLNDIITVDRAGGAVLYPSGQKILYRNDWHKFPEVGGQYVFFLNNDDDQNPNYKILTAYRLNNGKIIALDNHPNFKEFDGTSEKDFMDLILRKQS
jgi:hypothetical protein